MNNTRKIKFKIEPCGASASLQYVFSGKMCIPVKCRLSILHKEN